MGVHGGRGNKKVRKKTASGEMKGPRRANEVTDWGITELQIENWGITGSLEEKTPWGEKLGEREAQREVIRRSGGGDRGGVLATTGGSTKRGFIQ